MGKTINRSCILRLFTAISVLWALFPQVCRAQSPDGNFFSVELSGHVWAGSLLTLGFFSVAGAMPLCAFLSFKNDKRYYALSLTAFCAGMFTLSAFGLFSAWGETFVVWQLLAMVSLYLLPAGICTFVARSFPKEARRGFLHYLGRLYTPFALVSLIAVATNMLPLTATLKIFCLLLAVTLTALLFVLQKAVRAGKPEAETIIGALILLLVSGVAANGKDALETTLPLELAPLWGGLGFMLCLIIALKQAIKPRRGTTVPRQQPRPLDDRSIPRDGTGGAVQELAVCNPPAGEAQEGLPNIKTALSSFTHELNTPLGTGILAASQLARETAELYELFHAGELRKSDLEKHLQSYKEAAEIITANLQNAAEIVRHYRSEIAGKEPLAPQTFSVQKHIEQVLAELKPRITQAGHELHFACIDELVIESYPHMFTQIISNLVVNSLTHAYAQGQKGNLFLTVSKLDAVLELKYSDDGKGIDEQIINKIFDPYFTTNREAGNTGLGLSVVYNLVTRHLHGHIQCHSLPGKCTIFLIRIPLERS